MSFIDAEPRGGRVEKTPFSILLKCRITFFVQTNFVCVCISCFSKVVLVMWNRNSVEYSTGKRQMWKLGQDKEVECTLITAGFRGPVPTDTAVDMLILLTCSNLVQNNSAKSMHAHQKRYYPSDNSKVQTSRNLQKND